MGKPLNLDKYNSILLSGEIVIRGLRSIELSDLYTEVLHAKNKVNLNGVEYKVTDIELVDETPEMKGYLNLIL